MTVSFGQGFQAFFRSLAIRVALLAVIFVVVPIIFYRLFLTADAQQSALLQRAVEEKGALIASVLKPHLQNFQSESPETLQNAVNELAGDSMNIRILVRLIANAGPGGFSYIASAPTVSPEYLTQERDTLVRMGVFDQLAPTCDEQPSQPVRFTNPAGNSELLTSMTPLHIDESCWLIVTSQTAQAILSTSIGQPIWKTPTIHIAGLVYLLSTVIISWVIADMWRNIDGFRKAARRIRTHGGGNVSFREMNTIPELMGVADDFDQLVGALKRSKQLIIEAAEENAHALKAPLAVIAQAIEPLKRAVPQMDHQVQRSVDVIERSTARLDLLVSAARDLEQDTADLIYQTSRSIDLSQYLMSLAAAFEPTLTAEGKHLQTHIAANVHVFAAEESLETIVENLLENAASFVGQDGTVEIILSKKDDWVRLSVLDDGPGVPQELLPRIFERHFSARDRASANAETKGQAKHHYGLGLWIVRRNVEEMGGQVIAENRETGGFAVTVTIRAAQ